MNWYSGLLEGFLETDFPKDKRNILLVQIEKGKVIKDKLMNSEEYEEFHEKWKKTKESSDEYKYEMRTEDFKNNLFKNKLLKKGGFFYKEITDFTFEEYYERILQKLMGIYEISSKYIPEPFIKSTNGSNSPVSDYLKNCVNDHKR